MKIQFTRAFFTGTRSYAAKEIGELPDDRATALVTAGIATPVKDAAKVETATLQPPVETATKGK